MKCINVKYNKHLFVLWGIVLFFFLFLVCTGSGSEFFSFSALCCNMGQNDTIGKIELNLTFVLSHKSANSRNDIQ